MPGTGGSHERTFHFFNSLISVAISMFELIDRLAPALLAPCAATRRNAAPIILLVYVWN